MVTNYILFSVWFLSKVVTERKAYLRVIYLGMWLQGPAWGPERGRRGQGERARRAVHSDLGMTRGRFCRSIYLNATRRAVQNNPPGAKQKVAVSHLPPPLALTPQNFPVRQACMLTVLLPQTRRNGGLPGGSEGVGPRQRAQAAREWTWLKSTQTRVSTAKIRERGVEETHSVVPVQPILCATHLSSSLPLRPGTYRIAFPRAASWTSAETERKKVRKKKLPPTNRAPDSKAT